MKKAEEMTREELHAKDLSVPCTYVSCGAAIGEPCAGCESGIVHFGRRVRWLVQDRRPDLIPPTS